MIDIDGLSVQYGGVRALDALSLRVAEAEVVGVVGPSGAGKTTLFDTISGWLPLVAGTIRVEGIRVDGQAPRLAAERGVARSHQAPRLFRGMSVFDHALVGAHHRGPSSAVRHAAAREALEMVGLGDHVREPVTALDPRERCLVEIARALAGAPRVLMLDEPFRALDEPECLAMRALIADIARGTRCAVLIAERDPDVCGGCCDRFAVLHAGVKIAEGSLAAIIADIDVRDAYFGVEWRQ